MAARGTSNDTSSHILVTQGCDRMRETFLATELPKFNIASEIDISKPLAEVEHATISRVISTNHDQTLGAAHMRCRSKKF